MKAGTKTYSERKLIFQPADRLDCRGRILAEAIVLNKTKLVVTSFAIGSNKEATRLSGCKRYQMEGALCVISGLL